MKAKTDLKAGVAAEIAWARRRYPGARATSHRRLGWLDTRSRGGMAGFGAARLSQAGHPADRCTRRALRPAATRRRTSTRTASSFDEGPHISFTSNDAPPGPVRRERRRTSYEAHEGLREQLWRGHWIKHPAQMQPPRAARRRSSSTASRTSSLARRAEQPEIDNYEDWLVAELRPDVRRALPDGVHEEVPHAPRAKNLTNRLARPAPLSAHARGDAARSPRSREPLDVHYVDSLPVSDAGRLRLLSASRSSRWPTSSCGYRRRRRSI